MACYDQYNLVKGIEEDKVHGAEWLSNEAIKLLLKASRNEQTNNINEVKQKIWNLSLQLVKSRPSMAPMANKIGYLLHKLDNIIDLAEYRVSIDNFGLEIINSNTKNKKLIADNLKNLVGDVNSVFTYSYSDTVAFVIKEIGFNRIIVTESRPMLEGKLLAKELGEEGFDVLLLVDAAMDKYISNADFCLVGADSVQYDGSIINKIGSKLLAYTAKEHGLPFYVICDSSKFNVLNYLGQEIEILDKSSEEISKPLENVTIKNPYFEIIPSRLITSVITELGSMQPIDIKRKIKSMQEYVEPFYHLKTSEVK
jgi:translation initiation factor eIF-2B subunit delta